MSNETTAIQIATPLQGEEVAQLRTLSLSQAVDAAVAAIAVDVPVDVVLEHLMYAESLKRIGADAYDRLSAAAAAWITVNGEFECNGTRYYVGPKKVTKCINKAAVFDAMLAHCGGDMSAACEFIASEPWKHGSIAKELSPAQFKQLFEVTFVDELKEGKPKLNKADQRFIR